MFNNKCKSAPVSQNQVLPYRCGIIRQREVRVEAAGGFMKEEINLQLHPGVPPSLPPSCGKVCLGLDEVPSLLTDKPWCLILKSSGNKRKREWINEVKRRHFFCAHLLRTHLFVEVWYMRLCAPKST